MGRWVQDLLDPHALGARVAQPREVPRRVGQPVGVVDAEPVDHAVAHELEHLGVDKVERLGVLDAHAGQRRRCRRSAGTSRPRVVVEDPRALRSSTTSDSRRTPCRSAQCPGRSEALGGQRAQPTSPPPRQTRASDRTTRSRASIRSRLERGRPGADARLASWARARDGLEVVLLPGRAGGGRWRSSQRGSRSPWASISASTRSAMSSSASWPGRSAGREHRRVMDRRAVSAERRLDGQALDVDVGLHERRQVARQCADLQRLDPLLRRHARHLDTAVAGQVVDQPPPADGVGDVAVEGERLAGLARADDVSAVLDAGLGCHRTAVAQPRAQRLPLGDLRLAAARVLVERDVEALDQLRAPPPR